MKTLKRILLITIVFQLASCVDDDDNSVQPSTNITANDEELITTVHMIFTTNNGTEKDTFSFNDLDGDGGNVPIIDTIRLSASSSYNVSMEFLDASDPDEIEDITAEIKKEDDEHLVCFEQENINGLSIQRTDSDGTFEVGLESNWVSNMALNSNNGVVKVTLRHQPGSKDGSCNPGDTDVEIDFPLIVQ